MPAFIFLKNTAHRDWFLFLMGCLPPFESILGLQERGAANCPSEEDVFLSMWGFLHVVLYTRANRF